MDYDELLKIKEEVELNQSIFPKVYLADNGRKIIYKLNPEEEIHVYCTDPLIYKKFKNGILHNLYSPATRDENGVERYYINGRPAQENELKFWRLWLT